MHRISAHRVRRGVALALAIALGSLTLASTPAAAGRAEPAPAEAAGVRYAAGADQPTTLRDYVRYRDSVRAAARTDKRALGVACARGIRLLSWATGQYVWASSLHFTHTLQATAPSGYGDGFSICFTDTYDYIYDERLGNYVTTETGFDPPYTGLLRADASSVFGPRQKFSFECPNTVNYCYIYSHANFRYVTVEAEWGGVDRGMLRARILGRDFGDMEKFN